mmetsp:Transcript_17356/g.19956  ORF Transcript_17356/g.19956 Transcript_17356/m.19956 type:complete len:397 (+) Transcript_17356:60-1250(+)
MTNLCFKRGMINILLIVFIEFRDISSNHALPVINIINDRGAFVFGYPTTSSLSCQGMRLVERRWRQQQRNQQSGSSLFLSPDKNNANNWNGFSSSGGALFTRKNSILLFVLTPILLETYSRIGALFIPNTTNSIEDNESSSSFITTPLIKSPKTNTGSSWNDVEHVTIVFHGAGGQDGYTDELMKRLQNQQQKESNSSRFYSHIVDWSEYSTDILQASYNGQRIGKIVAKEISNQATNLKTIHFIGISVGAFTADSAVNEIQKIRKKSNNSINNNNNKKSDLFVQLTLLDPFQQRGIFGINYGYNQFGMSADYAQQYLNTDDPVPSTNQPLNLEKNINVCYDVTNLRPNEIFGHDWPLVYYTQSENCGKLMINEGTRKTDDGNEKKNIDRGTFMVL